VVTIGCRTSRGGDGGGDCVRASSLNQDNSGGGCCGAAVTAVVPVARWRWLLRWWPLTARRWLWWCCRVLL